MRGPDSTWTPADPYGIQEKLHPNLSLDWATPQWIDELVQRVARQAAEATADQLAIDRKVHAKRGRHDAGRASAAMAEVLRDERSRHGLTIAKLADDVRLHHTTISKIRQGQRGMSIGTLAKLSQRLGPDFVRRVLAVVRDDPRYQSS